MKTRTLNLTMQCMATYTAEMEVPAHLSNEAAIVYAKQHMDKIPMGNLQCIPKTVQIDSENSGLAPLWTVEISMEFSKNEPVYRTSGSGETKKIVEDAVPELVGHIYDYHHIPDNKQCKVTYTLYDGNTTSCVKSFWFAPRTLSVISA